MMMRSLLLAILLLLLLACSVQAFLAPPQRRSTTTTWGSSTCSLSPPRRASSPRPTTLLYAETVQEITSDAEQRMSKSIDSVKQNLMTIRTGRASPQILDRIKVSYYGVDTPLNQMATIQATSAQQLTIDAYDKSTLSDIEKAIGESDVGLTPNNDGSVIRLNIPQLTEDRRKELLKQCKALGEDGKVAIRNIRRDGVESIKKLLKAKTISEDESKDGQDVMQKMTDKRIKEIDSIVELKEKEVMKV